MKPDIRINDIEAGTRIADLAQTTFTPDRDACFSSHEPDGRLRGGAILTDYTGASMQMHVGGTRPHWVSRELLWIATHYPFVQLGCTSLIGRIASYDEHTQDLARRMGFAYETTIANCLPGGAGVQIWRLWRDRCLWHTLQSCLFTAGAAIEG